MNDIKAKVVGLGYHKVENPVKNGDVVYIEADYDNDIDANAVSVKNEDGELLGYIANNEKTLSPQNIKNGARSALQLHFDLELENKRFKAVVDRAFKSCLYIFIDSNDYEVINEENADNHIVEELKAEVEALKIEISLLESRINVLESTGNTNVVNTNVKDPTERILYSVVGLSHFKGQNNLDGELSIVEEPIYPNAKGTALYLKVGNERLGVFPSGRKREYCEQHKIPFYENQKLKKMDLSGEIRLEELVYDEYAIISI